MLQTILAGLEINEIDLVLLDADTARCISTFLARDGELDLWRTAVLGICYHDLAVINAQIDQNALEYFLRLEEMAKLVLQKVARKSKHV